jgi:uncharacterized membrane protein
MMEGRNMRLIAASLLVVLLAVLFVADFTHQTAEKHCNSASAKNGTAAGGGAANATSGMCGNYSIAKNAPRYIPRPIVVKR